MNPSTLQRSPTSAVSAEATLKELARRDRRAALEGVVRAYRDRLFQHALYIVKDGQEAYDVVQEVFIKAMREARLFDEDFHIKAWLFRVTSNLCYNIVRDRRRRGGILESLGRRDEMPAGQDDRVCDGERRDEVLARMEDLSRDHREILLLRYYDDLSYNEIAEVLGIRLGTVMSRLSRARARLGAVLGTDHPVVLEVLEGSGAIG
ncbi:MAG: RNA polymerase sigma factor [Deltaproteobacteria bacterium]|nr:RNA polymerase sigma factor [Deltaproteobacteria bacterium]